MAMQQVALIRGINVGPAKSVAMADLRALLEDLGYFEVKTLLNSGNAVFTAPDSDTTTSARHIEEALLSRTGISARTIVLTADELAAILSENHLAGKVSDPTRLLAAVFARPLISRCFCQSRSAEFFSTCSSEIPFHVF